MPPLPARAPSRVIVEGVYPEIDAGRFPAKRTAGEVVNVEADVLADGHEVLAAALRYRPAGGEWAEVAMTPQVNDRWAAGVTAARPGWDEYPVQAWIGPFAT